MACLLWLTPIAASTSRDVLLRIQRELFVGKRGFMSVARESATDLPCDTNTSTWRSFGRSLPACDASSAFWSSCLPKDIPQGGPIHWGWIIARECLPSCDIHPVGWFEVGRGME